MCQCWPFVECIQYTATAAFEWFRALKTSCKYSENRRELFESFIFRYLVVFRFIAAFPTEIICSTEFRRKLERVFTTKTSSLHYGIVCVSICFAIIMMGMWKPHRQRCWWSFCCKQPIETSNWSLNFWFNQSEYGEVKWRWVRVTIAKSIKVVRRRKPKNFNWISVLCQNHSLSM